jgi:hypothetical protein
MAFINDLKKVWNNAAEVSSPRARLIIRFGAISDRRVDAIGLLKGSLADTHWRIQTIVAAGSARNGKRQAETFHVNTTALEEFDLWAVKDF